MRKCISGLCWPFAMVTSRPTSGDLIYLQKAKAALSKFNSEPNRKVFADCIILWALRSLTEDRYGNADTQ